MSDYAHPLAVCSWVSNLGGVTTLFMYLFYVNGWKCYLQLKAVTKRALLGERDGEDSGTALVEVLSPHSPS